MIIFGLMASVIRVTQITKAGKLVFNSVTINFLSCSNNGFKN